MSNKLTLNVDKDIAEKAKRFARSQGRSLSNLIENYLKSLVESPEKGQSFSPIVANLLGSVSVEKPSEFDEKQVLADELNKKYTGD